MSTAEDELPNADETATTATTPPPPTPPLPPPPTTTTTTTATSHEKEIEKLSPEEQERALAAAQLCKNEGNEKYNLKEYDEAIDLYSKALDLTLPTDYKTERSVYFCNRAACNLALQQFDAVISDCTEALKLDNVYVKALLRRAHAYESLQKLQFAVNDYQKILELEPQNAQARDSCEKLAPLVAAQREKEKEEMIAKLKDLGNSFLGKFGISLDNFQAVKDPATGSYSINYKNK